MNPTALLERFSERLSKVEQNLAAALAQLKLLTHLVFGMTLLLLLTVIYGAIGERGFYAIGAPKATFPALSAPPTAPKPTQRHHTIRPTSATKTWQDREQTSGHEPPPSPGRLAARGREVFLMKSGNF